MSHPLTVTYDKSLELTQPQTSDTIFVTQSNNLLLIVGRLNTLLAARGDKQINYEDVELEIFNKSSDGQYVMVINLLPGLEVQSKSVVVLVSPSDNELMLKHKIARQLLAEGQVIHKSYVIRIADVCGNKGNVLENEETLGSLQVQFKHRQKYLIAYAIVGTELEMRPRDCECIQLL